MAAAAAAPISEHLLSEFEPNLLSHSISLPDSQQIGVNAYALATKSRYFHQRYAECAEETRAGQPLRLTWEAVWCPEQLALLLYFCHFDRLRDMEILRLRDCLSAAVHFKCKRLEQYASEYAKASLSADTANSVWLQVCGLPELPVTETVRLFVLRNFLALAERDDFAEYGIDALEELLRDDRLNAWQEDQLVQPLLRWLRGRATSLWEQMRLLSSLRFDSLSPRARTALAQIEGFQFFEGFRKSPMFGGMCSQAGEARRAHEGVLGLARNQAIYLDPRRGRVALLAPRFCLPKPRTGFACAVLADCRVLVAGGRKGRGRLKYTAECLCMDLGRDAVSWEPIAALNEARSGLSAVVCNSTLFVIGGADASGCLATVESLDTSPTFGGVRWRLRSPLPEARCHVGVASVAGRIVACGGYRTFPGIECQLTDWYDPDADQWTRLASMAHPRGAASLLELPGENPQLLVLGGNSTAGPERLQFYASGRRPRWVAAATATASAAALKFPDSHNCLADSRWLLAEKFAGQGEQGTSAPIALPVDQLGDNSGGGRELVPEHPNWLSRFALDAMVTLGGIGTIDKLIEFATWL